jgi:hypothetical protein
VALVERNVGGMSIHTAGGWGSVGRDGILVASTFTSPEDIIVSPTVFSRGAPCAPPRLQPVTAPPTPRANRLRSSVAIALGTSFAAACGVAADAHAQAALGLNAGRVADAHVFRPTGTAVTMRATREPCALPPARRGVCLGTARHPTRECRVPGIRPGPARQSARLLTQGRRPLEGQLPASNADADTDANTDADTGPASGRGDVDATQGLPGWTH